MRAILLVACVLAMFSGPSALAKSEETTVYCGKNWITFVAQLGVGKVKLDQRGFTIRKSQVLTVTDDMPNNTYIVMARSPTDPKVTALYYVNFIDYVKIIGCLD